MSNEDERGVLDLSDPKAREMQERISAAKQGNIPVGGVPMPKMPRLDQPPPGAPRDRGMGVQQAHQQQAQTQAGGSHTAMSADQHNKAIASGQAIGGVGSAYVANQPKGFQAPSAEAAAQQMEIKGDADNPANPARPEGGLRQETLDQINAVAEAQDTPEAPPEEGKEEEKKGGPEDRHHHGIDHRCHNPSPEAHLFVQGVRKPFHYPLKEATCLSSAAHLYVNAGEN